MIKRVVLRQFRNHDKLQLQFHSNKAFIYGDNGKGKTSILEAIYYGSLTKSHRTTEDRFLIKNNTLFSNISITTDKHLYELVIEPFGKRMFVDKKAVHKTSDYVGGYHAIMFSPEDLELVKGIPSVRRQFLDIEMSQKDKSYLFVLSKYKQILKQRNALLKNLTLKDDLTFLKILSSQLSVVADQLIFQRTQFIEALNQAFKIHFTRFNKQDEVDIVYQPNTPLKTLERVLNEKKDKDIVTQTTNYGPHRDDFSLKLNKQDAKTHASQGQQRLMVLSLKLALLDLIKDKQKEVVLLLDDVLSELDDLKKQQLITHLPNEHQVIISGVSFYGNKKEIQAINLNEGENEHGSNQQ